MLNCGDSNKYAQPINRKISMKELQSLKILIRKDPNMTKGLQYDNMMVNCLVAELPASF